MSDDPFDLSDLDTPPHGPGFPTRKRSLSAQLGSADGAFPGDEMGHQSGPSPVMTARADVPPPYLDGLNPPQRAAVESIDGPLLVLAGAGTGKTRVLTTRLAHIMTMGRAAPWQILAVTFTNKAAREMQERVAKTLGRPVEDMWIGTFHAICVRMLRRHAELVGLKTNFTILDTDDQIRLLKQLIEAEGIDVKRWPARVMAGLIDKWKNKALRPDQISQSDTMSFADGLGGKLYAAYQARLQVLNACDFGDLLLHMVTILQQNPDVLARYHAQFRYILVDEYQDTNVAQYLWLRLLAQSHKNICCVGDDDQSIYGWRGAEVGNILRFESDFPGAQIVRLEQNYRSTGNILKAAGHLIGANTDRLGKELWTEADDGEPVRVKGVWDAPEEARTVCDDVERFQRQGDSLSEMAILVRAGFQTREFEERLITLGINYRVVGGPRFYERAEIRDALAYFRVVLQSDDDLALERIVNIPKRGLGATSIQKVHHLARAHSVSMHRAAEQIVTLDTLRPAARTSLGRLMADFGRWRSLLKTTDHVELAEMILEESGYVEMWQKDKSPDAPGRLDNLKELINALSEFESLAGFMEHISLVMDNDAADDSAKLSLMTLHAAKGLEFDTVFLPGWEEGVFPNQRALDETGTKGLEEERRLAYVGITRAKKRAIICFAANRQVFGQWQSSLPSRFVDELPQDEIELESQDGLFGATRSRAYNSSYEDSTTGSDDAWGRSSWDDHSQINRSSNRWGADSDYKSPFAPTIEGSARTVSSQSFTSSYGRPSQGAGTQARSKRPVGRKKAVHVSEFAVGERVFHEKFGYGMVEDVEGDKLLIEFEHSGTKRVKDSFVTAAS